MSLKIVFYDADGTVTSKGKISPSVMDAMKKLEENNVITVLSTGRALPQIIHSTLNELNLSTAITAAGGAVQINNELVSHDYLPLDDLKEITTYLDSFGLLYNLECNDALYVKKGQKKLFLDSIIKEGEEKESKEETLYALDRRSRWELQIKETDNIYNLHVNKIHWFEADNMYENGKTPLTYEDVHAKLGDKYIVNPLSFTPANKGGEINLKGITKKKGMELIIKHFNIKDEDVYAIGDGLNDLQMLERASHSIAMGNAPKEVKDVCEFVTKDIKEDGFTYAMKHYNLI